MSALIKFRLRGTRKFYFMATDGSGVLNRIRAAVLPDDVAASEAENARGQGFDAVIVPMTGADLADRYDARMGRNLGGVNDRS